MATLVAIDALALSSSLPPWFAACAVDTFASKGGCGHPALTLPPMMSSVLFPFVVAVEPHAAGFSASGSAPGASAQRRAKEGCEGGRQTKDEHSMHIL
jgi:hypothetical protein